MKFICLFIVLVILNGCAVPAIVMEITSDIVAENLAEKQQEREKKQAAIEAKQDIIDSMHQYVEAINADNRQLLTKLSKKNAMTYTGKQREQGEFTSGEITLSYYLDINRTKRTQVKVDIFEKSWKQTFLLDNQIAMLWAPYDFYIAGKLSHCGINAFNFIKDEGKWLVTNASWSVQKTDCDVSSLDKA